VTASDDEQSAPVLAGAHDELARSLSHRQIQLIAIGGAIGVGLFLGSGTAIHEAGPAVLLSYVGAGVVVFLMLRALGEMALYRPVSGSFATYADEMLGPWVGFATGWVYWLMWMTTAMAEVTAIGIYANYFVPGIPQWIPALVAVILVLAANLSSAHTFGTVESVIAAGVAIVFLGVGNVEQASVSNLWDRGGFFPEGLLGPLIALQIVTFAFAGVEMIGVASGEAESPARDIPLAVNRVAWRILIFYVGAILVVLMIIPWDQIRTDESPFVIAWEAIGVPGAAVLLNLVVITSALSSCNTGLFAGARMLWSMSRSQEAPRRLQALNGAHVPARALVACSAVLGLGVLLNAAVPDKAFVYITGIATVSVLWVWAIIVVTHLRFRARVRRGELPPQTFRLPGSPWTNVVVLAYLALVVVMLAVTPDQRVALVAGAVVAVVLALAWRRVATSRAP
jgi:AAT family amino acid transporter/D-serine/D-alanine/glycine transporter